MPQQILYTIFKAIGTPFRTGRFTKDYYREKRVGLPIDKSLRKAYKSTIHSIMTSGLILIFCPYIMSILLTDPTISPILRSISVGALSSILLIIFVLPGLLAAFDKLVTGVHSRNG